MGPGARWAGQPQTSRAGSSDHMARSRGDDGRATAVGQAAGMRQITQQSLPLRKPRSTPRGENQQDKPHSMASLQQNHQPGWRGEEESRERRHTHSLAHTPQARAHAHACTGSTDACSEEVVTVQPSRGPWLAQRKGWAGNATSSSAPGIQDAAWRGAKAPGSPGV